MECVRSRLNNTGASVRDGTVSVGGMTNTPQPQDSEAELRHIVVKAMLGSTCTPTNMCSTCTVMVRDAKDEIDAAVAALLQWGAKARRDENESIKLVMEQEINEEPDHCYNCETHNNRCYACRKKKMYKEFARDFLRVLDERITQLDKTIKGEVE